MFSRDDARWFSETVGAFYSAQTTAEFTRLAIAAVHERFRLVATGCEEVGIGASTYVLHAVRCETTPLADIAAHFHDHPSLPLLATGTIAPVFHIREHISLSRWSLTDHFNGVARTMGFNDQCILFGQMKPTVFGITLNRDKRFSVHELAIFRLLQPHVAATLRRVHPSQSKRASTSLNFTLSPALRPVLSTPAQRETLRTYFPRWRESSVLPPEVHAWVVNSLRQYHEASLPKPLRTLAIKSARGRLLLRCVPGSNGKPVELCLVETPAVPDYFRLLNFGLTSRECEVLHWVAQGKRDAEIAAILSVAPKTVSKHLERVLAKLHAENRGTAVSAARHRLG